MCSNFSDCISEINNTQVDIAKNIDVVMPLYSLIEYSNIYLKTSGGLWEYYRDEPASDNNDQIIDIRHNNNIVFYLKLTKKITGETEKGRTKDVEIMILLQYLSNFLRTLEMPLITCEINLTLVWSANCSLVSGIVANQMPTFAITDAKLYTPVTTLSTQDNAKLLEQLQLGLKRTFNWNKSKSNITTQAQK